MAFLLLVALRVIVYYNEYDESVLELAYESVELGHFEREESFSAHDMTTLKTLIEDALPQLDEAIFNFSRSVCKALLAIDDHPSLMDESIAEYDRLIQLRCVTRAVTFFFFPRRFHTPHFPSISLSLHPSIHSIR